ncbi:hypothetical protein F5146DRAFT_1048852 [Armillaria mellea]|nr:hypothetical protein F5146DRAFT_1048852 [Armillaria mellea]
MSGHAFSFFFLFFLFSFESSRLPSHLHRLSSKCLYQYLRWSCDFVQNIVCQEMVSCVNDSRNIDQQLHPIIASISGHFPRSYSLPIQQLLDCEVKRLTGGFKE